LTVFALALTAAFFFFLGGIVSNGARAEDLSVLVVECAKASSKRSASATTVRHDMTGRQCLADRFYLQQTNFADAVIWLEQQKVLLQL